MASIRPDAKADPTPRGADNCCGLPGAAANDVRPFVAFAGLAESQSRSRLFHPTVRLRQCRAELSPARTVRRSARVGVTAIAPNCPLPDGDGFLFEEPKHKLIPAPVLPARPCRAAAGQRWLVRFMGEAIRFEVQGGRMEAVVAPKEEASLFEMAEAARFVALEYYGPSRNDLVTVEPYSPTPA